MGLYTSSIMQALGAPACFAVTCVLCNEQKWTELPHAATACSIDVIL